MSQPIGPGLPVPLGLPWLLWVLLVLGPASCRARSDHMAPTSAALGAPSTQVAQVVFIRPSAFAGNQLVTICDDQGGFLGDSPPVSHFWVSLPPGQHTFIAWASDATALRADLAAGHTYFVEVALRAGSMRPRVELLAQKAHTKTFSLVPTWLAQTEQLQADRTAGQAALRSRHGDLTEGLQQGTAALAALDPSELEGRRLRPDDGVTGIPFANLLPPPPAPKASSAAAPRATAVGTTDAPPAPPRGARPAGTAPPQPGCQGHDDCRAGHLCIGGSCALAVVCSGDDAECPTATTCQEGVCRP